MDKADSLHYFEEHRDCRHYRVHVENGFVYTIIDAGMNWTLDSSCHHLLIFMEGKCIVDCDRFTDRVFTAGNMVLIPAYSKFSGKAKDRLRFMDMRFTTPVSCCDKMLLRNYSHFRTKIRYDFRPLPVRRPLPEFCDMLAYCLKNNICCEQFHDMKHRELFFYLRGYYSKEEMTELLYPIINTSMDFKAFVCQNYNKVDSLDELIMMSNMSKRTFHRRFKAEFNMTAYQWMLKQTCNIIIDELSRYGSLPKDVAEKLGFDSASNFCNFCKRNIGFTPTELVQKCKNGEVVKEDMGC